MSRLITDDLKKMMIQNAVDTLKGRGEDHFPLVKLFCVSGPAIWLLSELNPFEQDIAYGLCDLGMGFPEMGYVSLCELENMEHPFLPIPMIVRDEHFEANYLMSVYAEAARQHQRITEAPDQLQRVCSQLSNKRKKIMNASAFTP